MRFCMSSGLKKKPKWVFLELNLIRIFSWCKRTKNGSSGTARTGNFLSIVRTKEQRCFLLKSHWSGHNSKLNAKAASLSHRVWLKDVVEGTCTSSPWLEGGFVLGCGCRQTRRSADSRCVTAMEAKARSGARNQTPRLRYMGSAAEATSLRWKPAGPNERVLRPVLQPLRLWFFS